MEHNNNTINKLHGFYFDQLNIGMNAFFSKTITNSDVTLFAGISGDTNPVHLNVEFASTTRFKDRIVHGMLTASLISTVIGTKLPGPGSIYVNQNLRFKAPVLIGQTATAFVEVVNILIKKQIVELKTICKVKGKIVLDGEAAVLVPERNLN